MCLTDMSIAPWLYVYMSTGADYVRELGAEWYPEAVPLHHHRRRRVVSLLADAVVPLAAVYQPRVPSPSLRLHHPHIGRVHSGRYVILRASRVYVYVVLDVSEMKKS